MQYKPTTIVRFKPKKYNHFEYRLAFLKIVVYTYGIKKVSIQFEIKWGWEN